MNPEAVSRRESRRTVGLKIKWLGHSCFLITSDSGTRIVTDPYTPGRGLNYGDIEEEADVVTISHGHGDHSNAAAISGSPQIISSTGGWELKGVRIRGVSSFHDDAGGSQRGPNVVFCLTVDGMTVCHMGDLGHALTTETVAELGEVHVVLIPVGGGFTIDSAGANAVVEQLGPKVVIPMHYRNENCAFPISTVDGFLAGKTKVSRLDTSDVTLSLDKLPSTTTIMLLKPAL
jgi:L-ascorbate metabolism protein UlaG (beta-lactamase superfamily)